MANIIDTRGRSCPEPVIMTKNFIEHNPREDLKILVDTQVAVENITRFATNKGFHVKTIENNGEYEVHIKHR